MRPSMYDPSTFCRLGLRFPSLPLTTPRLCRLGPFGWIECYWGSPVGRFRGPVRGSSEQTKTITTKLVMYENKIKNCLTNFILILC